MSYLPCLNPSCHSHGKPHPNCKCYSGMAEGGEAHFCSENRAHEPGCEYFAEGGQASADVPENDLPSMGQEVPKEDLSDSTASVPDDDIPENRFDTTVEKLKTGLEGAAEGATFGLSIPVEKAFGVKAEDIAARAATNPLSHSAGQMAGLAGSALIGVGEGAVLAKAGAMAGKAFGLAESSAMLGKIGSAALRGAVETGLFQSGNEISNQFLGQGNSPDIAAAHVAAAGALGLIGGGVFGTAGAALQSSQAMKMGDSLSQFAQGLGGASKGYPLLENVPKDFKKGYEFYSKGLSQIGKNISGRIAKGVGAGGGAFAGNYLGGVTNALPGAVTGSNIGSDLAEKYLQPILEKALGKPLDMVAKKIAVPIAIKAISLGETSGVIDALNYGTKAAKGVNAVNSGIDSLFRTGGQQIIDYDVSDKQRDKLKKYLDDGGIDAEIEAMKHDQAQQSIFNGNKFAHGGEVHSAPRPMSQNNLSSLYPEQDMMMNETKARMSNYLRSIRPQQPMMLPFDSKIKAPVSDKNFDRALDIAIEPLHVLGHIQKNTLLPEHVQHLNAMYPGVSDALKKKIAMKLVEHQLRDEKPSYKMRQSLSLFMGSPMDSSFTPQSIRAAQAVFAQAGQPQQQAPQKSKGGDKNKLDKAPKAYLTPDQSAISRQQNAR